VTGEHGHCLLTLDVFVVWHARPAQLSCVHRHLYYINMFDFSSKENIWWGSIGAAWGSRCLASSTFFLRLRPPSPLRVETVSISSMYLHFICIMVTVISAQESAVHSLPRPNGFVEVLLSPAAVSFSHRRRLLLARLVDMTND